MCRRGEEPDNNDADGWEALGKKAMLKDGEYDYACVCLNKALEIRIEAAGGQGKFDEAEEIAQTL